MLQLLIFYIVEAISDGIAYSCLLGLTPFNSVFGLYVRRFNKCSSMCRGLCGTLQDVVLAKPEMSFPALDTEPPAAVDKRERESSDAGSDDASHLQRTSVYDSVTSAESKSPFQRLPQDHSSSIRYCAAMNSKSCCVGPVSKRCVINSLAHIGPANGQLALLGLMLRRCSCRDTPSKPSTGEVR